MICSVKGSDDRGMHPAKMPFQAIRSYLNKDHEVLEPPCGKNGHPKVIFHQVDQIIMVNYIPGTQMTPVLIGNDLVLEGSTIKIEDIHRFQVHITSISLY